MSHVFQEEPFLVKFQSCPDCHGAYFNTGEFRDYMKEEIYEEFQDIVRHIE